MADTVDFITELEQMHKQMDALATPEPNVYQSAKSLGELDWLTSEPPERNFIFTQPRALGGTSGLLASGKTSMLVSPGGTGKTFALIQCAIAAATGTKWLETYQATKASKVVLITGEEDELELWRRIKGAVYSLGIHKKPELLALLSQNLIPIPLYGTRQRFSDKDRNPTKEYQDLKNYITKLNNCSMVIIDPASYFFGPECETSNVAATDWIILLNGLTLCPGNPAILVAHHANKSALKEGDSNQSMARGVTGIVDGFRWVANLEKKEEKDRVIFRLVKANYIPQPEPIELYRDFDNGGILRKVNAAEIPKTVIRLIEADVTLAHSQRTFADHDSIDDTLEDGRGGWA